MPWHAFIHRELPLVEVTFTGLLTAAELHAAASETYALTTQSGHYLILGDCSGMAHGGHSVFDLYDAAKGFTTLPRAKALKEAVIVPQIPDSSERASFWETTCFNHGLQVRLFTDRTSALAWLLPKP